MPTKSSAATTTTTSTTTIAPTTTTTTTTTTDDAAAVLDSTKDKSLLKKNEVNTQSNKLEKYKIIYNKKAESEFFVDNSALAGFTGERILYMAIRELIENSLDSCESFSILPSIKVSLKIYDQTNDLWTLSCEDNGTGINSEKLPVAVCSFLTSAKYMEKQQRGLFGVGLKMVAAFSTKDTDFPIKVWNHSIDESDEYYFELRTDIGTNKPIVLSKKLLRGPDARIIATSTTAHTSKSGFKIEVILRAKLMPITKNKIYEYVSETSIVNPYASITFETDDGLFHFDRRTSIMPQPAQEILPHPSDMDLKTLKKAISKFQTQKMSLPKILSSSFQKLSYEKAKDIVTNAGLSLKTAINDFSEHDLIKIVNICKKTRFQNPNTDHLSPIGENVLTIGMMSEYTIVSSKSSNDTLSVDKVGSQNSVVNNNNNKFESENTSSYSAAAADMIDDTASSTAADTAAAAIVDTTTSTTATSKTTTAAEDTATTLSNTEQLQQGKLSITSTTKNNTSRTNFSVKVLKPVLTTYTSRTCVINNRPTIVETGLAYGGDIPSFKMYRFANKIPLLYDEGSDVAREVISEVEINKMGITKKQAKEQFSTNNKESKKDRVIEVLPLHIFFHICSTKIPYKTAGKESIASEGELKYYMKSSLSELYRKLSTQIRKELKLKEAENKLRLYKHYLPFIVESINESLGIKNSKLNDSFSRLIENHLAKKPIVDENEVSAASIASPLPPPPPPPVNTITPTPSVSQTDHLNTSSSSSSSTSTTPNKSPGSTLSTTSTKSIPSSLQPQSLDKIDHLQIEKMNKLQKPKKQEKENSIPKSRPGKSNSNNNNQTKKSTSKSISQSDKSKPSNNNFAKNRKQDIKETKKSKKKKTTTTTIIEKKSKMPTTTIITKNKRNNSSRSDILKKDLNKIKIQKKSSSSSNKMSKKSGGGGGGRGGSATATATADATKIPSSHPSQTRQIQSTMDSFSKRVNKGKRK